MAKLLLIIPVLFISVTAIGQLPGRKVTREEYIQMYKGIAIEEMNVYHIPASITLAQGILESASGNSTLARKANNHFGIKCHKGWNGPSYHMDDDAKNECFRKYSDPQESFKDHSIFLSSRDRYTFLFDLDLTDYKAWAKGLKKAGYATNPKYPQLLIKIIEDYQLHQFDLLYNRSSLAIRNPEGTNQKSDFNNSGEDFKPISLGAANRELYENNGVKFIYARKGDTFYEIAQDFNIYTWQVYSYNDLKKNHKITEGQMLYLEKKKNKSPKSYHTVNPGETLYDISQKYGVKIKKLSKYNHLKADAKLFPAQRIKLSK
ncbi:MAG: glucosaminidase domain-containing protein [Bacteroidales bacterium]|nr:glucosaminidase domain-containing protein [Bacteroidales bacterium]